MGNSINLLPVDLAPTGSIAKIANTLRKVNVLLIIVFFTGGAIIGAILLVTSIQIRQVSLSNNKLTTNIKSLEKTEQRLVLAKDRIDKAGTILKKNFVSNEVQNLQGFYSQLPEDVVVGEVEVSEKGTDISILTTNSLSLSRLLATVVSLSIYKRVELISFNYNPSLGFISGLHLSSKDI